MASSAVDQLQQSQQQQESDNQQHRRRSCQLFVFFLIPILFLFMLPSISTRYNGLHQQPPINHKDDVSIHLGSVPIQKQDGTAGLGRDVFGVIDRRESSLKETDGLQGLISRSVGTGIARQGKPVSLSRREITMELADGSVIPAIETITVTQTDIGLVTEICLIPLSLSSSNSNSSESASQAASSRQCTVTTKPNRAAATAGGTTTLDFSSLTSGVGTGTFTAVTVGGSATASGSEVTSAAQSSDGKNGVTTTLTGTGAVTFTTSFTLSSIESSQSTPNVKSSAITTSITPVAVASSSSSSASLTSESTSGAAPTTSIPNSSPKSTAISVSSQSNTVQGIGGASAVGMQSMAANAFQSPASATTVFLSSIPLVNTNSLLTAPRSPSTLSSAVISPSPSAVIAATVVANISSSVSLSVSGSQTITIGIGNTAVTATAAAAAFVLPGTQLQVLPIGLGVFAGVSVIAIIVVAFVTLERRKYRKSFRERKMAEMGAGMGYGGVEGVI